MPVSPSESYLLAEQGHKLFKFWLAQQTLPVEPSKDTLEDLLESAFIAGYMRED